MKKTLLTLACACLAGSAPMAQTPGATDYKGNQFTNLSANGTWLIESGLESIRVYNTETGKFYDYIGNEGESYSAGLGSSVITENGTAVGASANGAVIFKDGKITPLPMLTGQGSTMNGANSITPDGKRIVGFPSLRWCRHGRCQHDDLPRYLDAEGRWQLRMQSTALPQQRLRRSGAPVSSCY